MIDFLKRFSRNRGALFGMVILIIVILLFASMRISRDTVQVVTEPTQRLLQMMRTSEALMSVFRAVADRSGKMDETISTVLDRHILLETWVAKSGEIGACGGGALEHPRRWQGAGGPASGPLPEGSLTNFHAARLVRGISEPSRTSRLSLMLRTERKGLGLGLGLLPHL